MYHGSLNLNLLRANYIFFYLSSNYFREANGGVTFTRSFCYSIATKINIVKALLLFNVFYAIIVKLYTCWTAPSLTFDLLCRSRLMLDEAKLSPTSVSICTTNQMIGEALSNKCFIMPKSLNNNIENSVCFGQIFSCSDDKYFQVNYIPNTHARWISNLLLCAD